MIPALATIVWAYVMARFFQIPMEYEGTNAKATGYLVTWSIVGGIVATLAWASLMWTAFTVQTPTLAP